MFAVARMHIQVIARMGPVKTRDKTSAVEMSNPLHLHSVFTFPTAVSSPIHNP